MLFACSISFALRDCFGNDIATCQVETPLKARIHQLVQPALPQASPDFGSTQTTVSPPLPAPPPPTPRIVDIIPRFGPHFASQRIWVKVENLPRGNGLHYLIGFEEAGTVATSFVCSEGDQVQILECATPITSRPCYAIPSLMYHHDPQILIGSSDVYYGFAPQSS
jgi:hypothetical protein